MANIRSYRPALPVSFNWLLVIAGIMALFPATASAAPSGLIHLNSLSQQLINKVKHGDAEATAFRTNVVYYRESLRSLMLANEKTPDPKLSNAVLMQMVRMAALLQSAAECHTGRYITCPANLMHELDQQQSHLDQVLTQKPKTP